MTSNDYSLYLRNRKVQVSQAGFSSLSSTKTRAPVSVFNYFPLYKGIGLPINNLRSNKFLQSSSSVAAAVRRFLITSLDTSADPNDLSNGEPTSIAYDGVNTLYISFYYPTSSGTGIGTYNISNPNQNGVVSYLTKAQSTNSTYGLEYDVARSCLYAGNLGGDAIVKITIPGNTVTTLASTNQPWGIGFDKNTYLYVCNAAQHTISRIDVTNGTVTIFAGSAGSANTTDGNKTSSARFNSPQGVVCDGTTAVYVADSGNYTIRKIDIATGLVTTIAGTAGQAGFVDGVGAAARFRNIRGLSIDSTNRKIYITDETNHAFRELNLNTNEVVTVAGSGTATPTRDASTNSGISGDGNALTSTFVSPRGCLYVAPYLYIADTRSNQLKRLTFA